MRNNFYQESCASFFSLLVHFILNFSSVLPFLCTAQKCMFRVVSLSLYGIVIGILRVVCSSYFLNLCGIYLLVCYCVLSNSLCLSEQCFYDTLSSTCISLCDCFTEMYCYANILQAFNAIILFYFYICCIASDWFKLGTLKLGKIKIVFILE